MISSSDTRVLHIWWHIRNVVLRKLYVYARSNNTLIVTRRATCILKNHFETNTKYVERCVCVCVCSVPVGQSIVLIAKPVRDEKIRILIITFVSFYFSSKIRDV